MSGHECTPELAARACALIAEHLGLDPARVTPARTFADLGADSLDVLELTLAFEDAFGLTISDDEAQRVTMVGEALALVARKTGVS